MRTFLFGGAIVFASAALAEDPTPFIPKFAEETAASGLSHKFAGGWQYISGGGVAVFDCNGDDMPEVFMAGGRDASSFFLNKSAPGGALAFEKVEGAFALDAILGAYPIDVDSDGILDLAVMRVGEDQVYRGKGDCAFEQVNEAWGFQGLDLWSTAFSATWEDGLTWPTFAVGTFIDRAMEDMPWGHCTKNQLYRPNAEGNAFAPPTTLEPSFCAQSILFTDWNRSGTPSLRISNDREYYKGGTEQMWHVEPGKEPRIYTKEEGWQTLKIWGMGIASRDVTNDLLPDYYLTSMADNKLQVVAEPPQDGKVMPRFADVALKTGVVAQRPYVGGDIRPSTAWHAQFEDVNNDGLADLFVAKGNVAKLPDFANNDPNNLLLQKPDGTFVEVGDKAGVASMMTARGGAVEDLNADGWLDIIVNNRNMPAEVWRNLGGAEHNWIKVRPRQDGTNLDAIGAWVEVRSEGSFQTRERFLGGGHNGGPMVPLHFGTGAATAVEVNVIWPDDTETGWTKLDVNRTWTITKAATGPLID
ncbi:MAG: hypothetical protein RLZZ528_904 [Pseudomonadota bacterium]